MTGMLLVAAAVGGACTDSVGPESRDASSPERPGVSDAPPDVAGGHGIDAEFTRLSRQIPGFGGMYYDRAHTLHVYMAGARSAASLKSEDIASRLRSMGGPAVQRHLAAKSGGKIVIDQATYDYGQLQGWKERLRDIFHVPGVVYTDIDESHNRLRIAITSSASPQQVQRALTRAGVPLGAVLISRSSPIAPLKTLQDRFRPVPGGAQIVFEAPSVEPGAFFVCTVGFNAELPDRPNQRFFVTASHCSDIQGGNQHTTYYQPAPDFGGDPRTNRIATEFRDPQYGDPGGLCVYAGARCRLSDALLARYTSPSLGELGSIARTTFSLTRLGSIRVDSDNPRWTIVEQLPFPFEGDIIDKVGRSSGWTAGAVIATCVDVGESDTDIVELCQDFAAAGDRGGDSGSPVFERFDPSSGEVALVGTLWGGGTLDGAPVIVFSAMENIEFELGPLIATSDDLLAARR